MKGVRHISFGLASLLGFLGAWGCRDSAAPVRATPLVNGSVLSNEQLRAMVIRVAEPMAERGDLTAASVLRTMTSPSRGYTPVLHPILNDLDPNDPSTWGLATIRDPHVGASLQNGSSFAMGYMWFGGHVGTITIDYDLSGPEGNQSFSSSHSGYNWNPFAPMYPLVFVSHGIALTPGGQCGYTLDVNGLFESYFLALPLPTDLGSIQIPVLRIGGNSAAVGPAQALQDACQYDSTCGQQQLRAAFLTSPASPAESSAVLELPGVFANDSSCTSDTGGSGGGAGTQWVITVLHCWGWDYYVDGVYVYSVIEGCYSYTYTE